MTVSGISGTFTGGFELIDPHSENAGKKGVLKDHSREVRIPGRLLPINALGSDYFLAFRRGRV